MVFLLLSIACSVIVGFIFKLFVRHEIQMFQAIMFNYFTCVLCGVIHTCQLSEAPFDRGMKWVPWALFLGLVFVTGYNILGFAVRYYGISISQILLKMSILVTVPFAILVYGESSGALKLLGIVLAFAAIILVNWPQKDQLASGTWKPGLLWIPVLTWLLSGIIEMVLIVVNHDQLINTGDPEFITAVFGTAGALSMALAIPGWATRRLLFSWRNVVAGIFLGIPNYGTILFMLLALNSGLEASLIFPVNNVGIILATTLGALWLFQERLTLVNWLGFAIAIVAILLIAY